MTTMTKIDDDDDDDVSDIDISSFNPGNFVAPQMHTFGLNSGRSAPSHRRAVGVSSSSPATVHVCTNCGSEFVKWYGRCPTCREWNTVQEMRVGRSSRSVANGSTSSSSSSSASAVAAKRNPRPVFRGAGSDDDGYVDGGDIFDDYGTTTGRGGSSYRGRRANGSSWLDEVGDRPVPVTEVYETFATSSDGGTYVENRLIVPDDDEINTVLGGGIVPGSITLIGGDPGVGKSTMMLQIAGALAELSSSPRGIGMGLDEAAKTGQAGQGPVIYASGEETTAQVASRASRLGIGSPELLLLSDTSADRIAETVVSYFDQIFYGSDSNSESNDVGDSRNVPPRYPPCLLVVDSIQTMSCMDGGSSAPGGVTQVRECVGLFMRLAKSTGVPIVLVGHVTKQGGVAGPRTVEHMVDAVLYLEGNGLGDGATASIRMLRAAKNRFGSAEEVGVYSMNASPGDGRAGGRLIPVSDPSSLFLSSRMDEDDVDGCAVLVQLEGLRPITVEVQALVSSGVGGGGASSAYAGRRVADGISQQRLLLILAVLQKRCGIQFRRMDVYVNVVSGIQISRSYGRRQGTESDLAVAVSLVSSLTGIAVRSDTCFVGEIGLLGELRQVSSLEKRVKEAKRMGFSRIITPPQFRQTKGWRKGGRNGGRTKPYASTSSTYNGIEWIQCNTILEALNAGLVSELKTRKRGNRKRHQRQVESESPTLTKSPNESWDEWRESKNNQLQIILDDMDEDKEN